MSSFKLSVERLYNGNEIQTNRTLTIENGSITSIDASGPSDDIKPGLLVPGFIDVQVNGGGGFLFNDSPTVKTIESIGLAHSQYGTTGWLPTLVTDSYEKMLNSANAVAEYLLSDRQDVLGIHFEGPFLSTKKKGVHSQKLIRTLSDVDMALLTRNDIGKVLLTVAPENVEPSQIKELVNSGVIVSLGHSNGTYAQASAAIEAGATGFTHLFNAMSAFTSREPGVVGTALASKETFSGIILDGIHVHPTSAKIAYGSKTDLMLVTDAMPPVGTDATEFQFFGQSITRKDNRLTDGEGRLAGSTLDMLTAVLNAAVMFEIDFQAAVDLASINPAKFLGIETDYGKVASGYQANLLLINDSKEIESSWIEGQKIF